jgi:hypothetical protein
LQLRQRAEPEEIPQLSPLTAIVAIVTPSMSNTAAEQALERLQGFVEINDLHVN